MSDGFAEAELIRLVFHDDDDTPEEFVIDLARSVFGKSEREAIALIARVQAQGKAICGPYPTAVAKALLESAQQQIRASGHPLRISAECADARRPCSLCGAPSTDTEVALEGGTVWLCSACVLGVKGAADDSEDEETSDNQATDKQARDDGPRWACDVLARHFEGISPSQLVTTVREFPAHMRADVQAAVDLLFNPPIVLFGIHEEYQHQTLSFARLLREGRDALPITPLQYEDVDVGDDSPLKCLNNGLWLFRTGELRCAVLLCFRHQYGVAAGIRIEIAVPTGAAGADLVKHSFALLEKAVQEARCYRGKILSLDTDNDYRGQSTGITVHRLHPVRREEVILPEQTLKLLDRNILHFIGSRDALRRLGQSTRKGILLYGPPGAASCASLHRARRRQVGDSGRYRRSA